MHKGSEPVRKYQKLTPMSVETLTLRNRMIAMDEGNFLGHNIYLVRKKERITFYFSASQLSVKSKDKRTQ